MLIKKHSDLLKEIFIGLTAISSYPAIMMNEYNGFVSKCQIIAPDFDISKTGIAFIAANVQQPENPKF
jgi:hypothetical protein